MEQLDLGRASRPEASEVLTQLFAGHHRRLVGLAALLVDDQETAEDLVQDAFAGLHRRWRLLRDPDAAVAYLNRAVVNGGRSQLRRRTVARENVGRMVPVSEALASAEHTAVDHDQAERIWHAVTQLPHRQRQVLVLRYYLAQSEAEIADVLSVSRGSVKKHASRGLAALARSMEEQS
jgi:RNA polymerase sigma-70 factor (sigma-E family)